MLFQDTSHKYCPNYFLNLIGENLSASLFEHEDIWFVGFQMFKDFLQKDFSPEDIKADFLQ